MIEAICVALVMVLFVIGIVLISKNNQIESLEVRLENSKEDVKFHKLMYESVYEHYDSLYSRHKKLQLENQYLKSTMNSTYGSPTFVTEIIRTKTGE